MSINARSIRFRLIIWYSGLITAVSLVFGAAIYRDVEGRLLSNMEQTLSRRTQQLSADLLPHWSDDSSRLSEAIEEVYSPEATNRFIRITDENGTIIYRAHRPDDRSFDPAKIPDATGRPGMRVVRLSDGSAMMVVSVATQLGKHDFTVEVGSLTTETETVLRNLLGSLAVGLPLVALIVSAGGYILVRRSLSPVEQLRATAQKITFGDLHHRLPVTGTGDEIEDLAVTLNHMLQRLSEAYDQARRFSADASHELRTPLAIIRGELEWLSAHSGPLPLEVKDRLVSTLEEVERMSRITESLFALSRLEAGEAKAEHVRLDLSYLARNTVDQMRLLADEKQIALRVENGASVYVQGDSARLKQVIVDLLDNALKYTPAGGRITLRAYVAGGDARLDVSDTGIGIPEEALPHVFERFYRADKARSREIEGSGLGLAIVRTICQAHGGSIDIESVEGSGTTCHIRLPLAA